MDCQVVNPTAYAIVSSDDSSNNLRVLGDGYKEKVWLYTKLAANY